MLHTVAMQNNYDPSNNCPEQTRIFRMVSLTTTLTTVLQYCCSAKCCTCNGTKVSYLKNAVFLRWFGNCTAALKPCDTPDRKTTRCRDLSCNTMCTGALAQTRDFLDKNKPAIGYGNRRYHLVSHMLLKCSRTHVFP
jgi:hypothetical protein